MKGSIWRPFSQLFVVGLQLYPSSHLSNCHIFSQKNNREAKLGLNNNDAVTNKPRFQFIIFTINIQLQEIQGILIIAQK